MIVAVTLALLIAVLLFVGYPLVRTHAPEREEVEEPAASQLNRLLSERENALGALKELELEHGIGNLSDEDYAALRGAQRHKAVAILREMDRLGDSPRPSAGPPDLDEQLEAEIARARRRLADNLADDGAARRCPSCGALSTSRARLCGECGLPLRQAAPCPSCGTALAPRATVCSACGIELGQRSRET